MNERLNMRRFEMPERLTIQTFDPEVDITRDDWRAIEKNIAELTQGDRVGDIAMVVANYRVSSGREWPLDAKISQQIFADAMFSLDVARNGNRREDWRTALHRMRDIRLIGIPLLRELESTERTALRDLSEMGETFERLEDAAALKIAGFSVPLFGAEIPDLRAAINKAQSGETLANEAAYFRIAAEADPEITTSQWDLMRSDFERAKINIDFSFGHVLRMASSMKILAADEVIVTDKGLEFVMPARTEEKPAPRVPEAPHIP